MCAIVGSFSKETTIALFELNSYRGEISSSISSFNMNSELQQLNKYSGKFEKEYLDNHVDGMFYIGHSQAPTTNTNNIHPSEIGEVLLWHNGIIKQNNLDKNVWDTEWLLQRIITEGWSVLSKIDGSFACVLYRKNKLYLFRNEICPLFINDKLDISSTKFDNSKSLEPNTVFEVDLTDRTIHSIESFLTKENPYFFG